MEKKQNAVTTKLCDSDAAYVKARYKQLDMESESEFIRSLIQADREKAEHSFNLLAEALCRNVSTVYQGDSK